MIATGIYYSDTGTYYVDILHLGTETAKITVREFLYGEDVVPLGEGITVTVLRRKIRVDHETKG